MGIRQNLKCLFNFLTINSLASASVVLQILISFVRLRRKIIFIVLTTLVFATSLPLFLFPFFAHLLLLLSSFQFELESRKRLVNFRTEQFFWIELQPLADKSGEQKAKSIPLVFMEVHFLCKYIAIVTFETINHSFEPDFIVGSAGLAGLLFVRKMQ